MRKFHVTVVFVSGLAYTINHTKGENQIAVIKDFLERNHSEEILNITVVEVKQEEY